MQIPPALLNIDYTSIELRVAAMMLPRVAAMMLPKDLEAWLQRPPTEPERTEHKVRSFGFNPKLGK